MVTVYKYGPTEPSRLRVVLYGAVRPREKEENGWPKIPFPDYDKIIRRGKLSAAFKKALDTYMDILCEAEKTISLSRLGKRDKNKLKKSLHDCLDVLIKLEELMLSENTGLADLIKFSSEMRDGFFKKLAITKEMVKG